MGRIVIAAYRPKSGKADDLRRLASMQLPLLRSQNLVTDRAAIMTQRMDRSLKYLNEPPGKPLSPPIQTPKS